MVTSQEARLQCTVACFNGRFVGEKKLPLVMTATNPIRGTEASSKVPETVTVFFFSRSYADRVIVLKFGGSNSEGDESVEFLKIW
jgi:hypothetical protein